jgi:type VI secretion system protein ImpG
MFSRYYQSELSFLREMGKEFAAVNPALAGLFSERGGDPDVERLLEGFAFLTSRIRQRVDDAVPEIVDALAQLLIPQMARPIPACSVVEFQPRMAALRGSLTVAAGTELWAAETEGTRCRFRTVFPVELLPLELTRTELELGRDFAPRLRLRFRGYQDSMVVPQNGALRLFVQGPIGVASDIFLWVNRHLRALFWEKGDRQYPLPLSEVRPQGVAPDFNMLPWPDNAPAGLRLLQEYLTFESKLMFFDIGGLDRLPQEEVSGQFDLVMNFSDVPELPERPSDKIFRLFCVPVVNLFSSPADPIVHRPTVHENLVRATDINPRHCEIYSVDSVVGMKAGRGKRQVLSSFFDFNHLEAESPEHRFFFVRRNRSPLDDALDSYLSVVTPADVAPDPEDLILSLEVTCTNRNLAAELRQGDICLPSPSSPALASFVNITEVTKPARPPAGGEMHWRLVSHLALNARSVTEASALEALLSHYNIVTDYDHQRGLANTRRIKGLRSLSSSPEIRMIDRAPLRGFHTTVEVESANYASPGDAFLFGCVLHWFFATEVPVNCFHRLTMRLHPGGLEFQWPATTGSMPAF